MSLGLPERVDTPYAKTEKGRRQFSRGGCAGISLKPSTASALPVLVPAGFPGMPGVLGHLTAIIGGVPLLLAPPATLRPSPHGLRLASLWPQLPRQTHVPPEAQKMPPASSECVTPQDPCQLLVSRIWAWGCHETWLEALLPSLPIREPKTARGEPCVQGLPCLP